MGLSIMDLHKAEAALLTITEEGAIPEVVPSTITEEGAIPEADPLTITEEGATLVEAHSEVEAEVTPAEAHSALAVAEATVVEVPLVPEVTGAEAKAAATAEEAVVSAEAVKMRTSAFIIRWTSRIGHFA